MLRTFCSLTRGGRCAICGHLKQAVNLPVYKAFDATANSADAQLQHWIGTAGLDDQATPVIYDFDGQNGVCSPGCWSTSAVPTCIC
jgi:hypothetical protein